MEETTRNHSGRAITRLHYGTAARGMQLFFVRRSASGRDFHKWSIAISNNGLCSQVANAETRFASLAE